MIECKQKYPNSLSYKYTLEEVTSSKFKAKVEKAVVENAHILMKNFLHGKKNETTIEIVLNSGTTEKIYGSNVVKEMKKFLPAIVKSDPEIVTRIKSRIESDADRIGIDSRKYCFDKRNVELLAEQEVATASKPEEQKQPVQYTYKPMTEEEILASQRKLAAHKSVK